MEATSARMAASRHQFEGFPPPRTQLQRYIYNACDPLSNLEPNLALNLEIVDLINQKKGNAPREAAVQIVQLINHRNPNVSLLALALLDNCVKNCGYPFHLQISTKEFLNELVRRFPERPPIRASRVQNKILEAIEEWRATICQTSRYKEDLGFIRDMHRLLLYKGYMFPEVRRDDAAVLNPSDNLKSAEEMEQEERAAQSAKLQELIRRGTPHDLQEANRLMKVMAGYDTRNKTDYRAKAAEEVSRVQQKARILEEMLQGVKEGDKIEEGDVFEELVNALQSAHPKIQRMCEEESEDAEAVQKLLEINDSIHRTVERYKLMKAGQVTAANNIPKGTLGTTTGVSRNAANELSLIDFDPEPNQSAGASSSAQPAQNGSLLEDPTPAAPSKQATVEDDLLGLSLGSTPTGGISLGGSTLSDLFSAPQASVPQASEQAQLPLSTQFSVTPTSATPQPPSIKPNYDAFASLSSALPRSKPATPVPGQQRPAQVLPASDPFAILVSPTSRPTSRPSTPSTQQNGIKPASGLAHPVGQMNSIASAAPAEDDWNFVSAPPAQEPALPEKSTLTILDRGKLKVIFECMRQTNQGPVASAPIFVKASFTNQNASPITALNFQVAVEKVYTLLLQPQSGKDLPPHQPNAVTQNMLVSNVPPGKGTTVKIRFKASYLLAGVQQEEQGMLTSLGLA
ncbi:ARF-binding protein [Lithohypha guttulata]|uniref:ARF-binding protein n=1 Tax=Lithohypha guttulata TaxID=1690604 RepID=A0AAN7SUV1_9EURO|nr:ARF-binding protein [Lithohypha guttulata]